MDRIMVEWLHDLELVGELIGTLRTVYTVTVRPRDRSGRTRPYSKGALLHGSDTGIWR